MIIARLLASSFISLRYRGYGKLCRFILPKRLMTLPIHNKSTFSFYLNDPYWNLLLCPSYQYEQEIGSFMDRYLDEKSAFVDCGANLGFWTIKALEILAENRVCSVEASSNTFSLLESNLKLNQQTPKILQRAVTNKSGDFVNLETVPGNHAGASVANNQSKKNKANIESVETVSLDSLVEPFHSTATKILIKLDIEGCELDAISTFNSLKESNIVVLVEIMNQDSDLVKYIESRSDLTLCAISNDGLLQREFTIEDVFRTCEHTPNFALVSDRVLTETPQIFS